MTEWTKTWPEGDGDWYWFYGSPYGVKENVLMAVRVWKTYDGFCYLADGHFIYPDPGHAAGQAVGVWLPVALPELPEEGNIDG